MAGELYVDASECTGCELCADALPAVFRMNSEGASIAHDSAGASESEIKEIIDNCPAECIHWK